MSRFDVVGFGAFNMDKVFKVNGMAAKEEECFITGPATSYVARSRKSKITDLFNKIVK